MLEIRHVLPRRGHTRAQTLPYSLRVDSQVWNFKKENTCSHNMQLSDRQELPRFGRNLDRKMALRHGKTLWQSLFVGLYLSNPTLTSRKFATLSNKVSQTFQEHQDHRKPTSGATSTVRRKTDKNKKKHAGNLMHFFPRTAAFARRVFPTCYELIHKIEL